MSHLKNNLLNMRRVYFIAVLLCFNLLSWAVKHRHVPILGDTNVVVFDSTLIQFLPNQYGDYSPKDGQGVERIANGRIILKKIDLPNYKRNLNAKLKITLASNGDRWDKTGSCFVIPKSDINMVSVAQGDADYPMIDASKYEKLSGIVSGGHYIPTVELMRFMTPFGVGYYSKNDDPLSSKRKPVYIPKWEQNVEWIEDITPLYSMLEDEAYIGIYIDTWTAEGYVVSAEIILDESKIGCDNRTMTHVKPLINTMPYFRQGYPDIFSRRDLEVDFDVPENAKNVRLRYITTGHGGHSKGDEFVQKQNIVSIDNNVVIDFIPWRDDCASFRRFNPATGVWLSKRVTSYIGENGYTEKEIEEPIASSDLSRSNWCPGSYVEPVEVALGNLDSKTKHKLTISIPEAQSFAEKESNFWLVSAYLVWEE